MNYYFEDNIIALHDYHNNITENNKNNKQNAMHNNYYYNNNYNNKNICDENVLLAYYETFGRDCPIAVQRQLNNLNRLGGYAWDFLRAVIEYTAMAPRPSWAYASYVIRCYDPATTEADFWQHVLEHQQNRDKTHAHGYPDEDLPL